MNTPSDMKTPITKPTNPEADEAISLGESQANTIDSRATALSAYPLRLQFVIPHLEYKPVPLMPYKLQPPQNGGKKSRVNPQERIQDTVDRIKQPELRALLQTVVQEPAVKYVMCMCRDQNTYLEKSVIEYLHDAAMDSTVHHSLAQQIREVAYVTVILMGCIILLDGAEASTGTASDFLFKLAHDDLLRYEKAAPITSGFIRECLNWHAADVADDEKDNSFLKLTRRMQCSLDLSFNYHGLA